MNSLNSILLEGNLVRDPEFTDDSTGEKLCKFSIESNRFYKNDMGEYNKETSFFKITAWGNLAKICSQRLKKDSGVQVVGRLKQDRWKGNDGKEKSSVYVIADHVEFKPIPR